MRKLVAALACRAQGSRLYGKPLQNLDVDEGTTILDHMLDLIETIPVIQGVVLGIADGTANLPFVDLAKRRGVEYIIGDERDVLMRLIQCGRKGHGTDIFRVTTESPFFYYELIDSAWARHVQQSNDVTTMDGGPEGSHFEIYKLDALEASHNLGDDRHRSEYCSLYIREHLHDFRVEVLAVPPDVGRLDLRLTVDYPEDLVLCRRVYGHLKHKAPRLPLSEIVRFIDEHPDVSAMVKPYVVEERLWPE